MPRLSKHQLLDIVVQSINEYGWNVLYVSDISSHPFRLKIYSEDESCILRIYIWNLTHGGGAQRPKHEYRIQITGVDRFEHLSGEKTLILGWWADAEVFAGFDFRKHSGILGASPSIQIREESLRKAHLNGISPWDKGNGEIAIAFRPDFFVEYVRNLEDLHSFGKSLKDLKVLEEITERPLELNEALIETVSAPRQKTAQTISRKLRDNSFKLRVLTAYTHKCAFCGLQMKLVDASHILPVSADASTDETSNGIALCSLHHRAYDISLVTFNEKYQILYNELRMRKLAEIGHDSGMKKFINDLKAVIHAPPSVSDRPNTAFVAQANEIRGWKF